MEYWPVSCSPAERGERAHLELWTRHDIKHCSIEVACGKLDNYGSNGADNLHQQESKGSVPALPNCLLLETKLVFPYTSNGSSGSMKFQQPFFSMTFQAQHQSDQDACTIIIDTKQKATEWLASQGITADDALLQSLFSLELATFAESQASPHWPPGMQDMLRSTAIATARTLLSEHPNKHSPLQLLWAKHVINHLATQSPYTIHPTTTQPNTPEPQHTTSSSRSWWPWAKRPPPPTALVLDAPKPTDDTWAWTGWGTSLCWFAHAIGGHPEVVTEVARRLFDADTGLGMNIVRYNLGGADATQAHEYRPGAAVPCFKTHADDAYNWDADACQVAMLKAGIAMGVDTVQAFCNSPPFYLTESQCSRGHRWMWFDNLPARNAAAFASYVHHLAHHFETTHGIRFHSVAFFNEPSSPTWTPGFSQQEGCYFSHRRALDVLRAHKDSETGAAIGLSVFDENCVSETAWRIATLPSWAWGGIKVVCTHTYTLRQFIPRIPRIVPAFQDNTWVRSWLRRKLKSRGVPLWVSEYGHDGSDPKLHLGEQIMYDLRSLQPEAWVYWQAVEQGSWGLLIVPFEKPKVGAIQSTAMYDALRVFTRHLRPGGRMFAPPRDNMVACVSPAVLMSFVVIGPCEAFAVKLGSLAEVCEKVRWTLYDHVAQVSRDGEVDGAEVLVPALARGSIFGATFV